MKGFVKRDILSVPFLAPFPKMTHNYLDAMDDLFFRRNISRVEPGDVVVALGNPIMIKEEVDTLCKLELDGSNSLILCGGQSPAYKKPWKLEFYGAAAIEIFKKTFSFDFKEPEALRVFARLKKRKPRFFDNCFLGFDSNSSNTYKNMISAWNFIKFDELAKKGGRVVIAASAEHIPRAIETFQTIADMDLVVKGLPYDINVLGEWDESIFWRSRFAAEVERLRRYSDKSDDSIENHIDLTAETRAILERVLQLSR